MKKTIFYNKHKNLEAKLVDFAGWEMPINYSAGIIKESGFVRDSCGMFDVSHMGRIEIKGKNATKFIEKILPIDVNKIKISAAKYTLLINEKKEILDDLIVYKISEEEYLLVINASNTSEDLKWITKNNKEVKILNITDNTGMLAIQGPEAINKINLLSNNAINDLGRYKYKDIEINGISVFVARTGYTGEDGVELIFDNNDAEKIWDLLSTKNIEPCGLGSRDLLRIEAGLHLYGHEINKNSNPVDIGLGRVLESKSTSYINHEYITGNDIKSGSQSLVGLIIKDRGIAREGNDIYIDGKIIGKITSGTHSPRINSAIAIGKIDKNFNIIENEVKIKVREKFLEAKIVKLPFYRRKK
jgi:glycine cleavage system T protein